MKLNENFTLTLRRYLGKLRYRYRTRRNFRKAARSYAAYSAISLDDRHAGFFSIFLQVLAAYKIARINKQKLLLTFTEAPYFDRDRDEPT
jgi:hypothetical protein